MRFVSIMLAGSSLFAAGCLNKGSSTDVDSASAAVDSSDSVNAEGNMMMASVDGSDMTSLTALTGDQVAATIAANVAQRWTPSTCATVTQTGADLAIKYDDCTGPRGLVHVTGELDLVVTVSLTGGISVHGTSTGLEVNSATLDIDVDATYAVTGTSHTLTVMTQGTGTGPRGNEIDHNGNYTVTWDPTSTCGSIDGSWSTEISSTVASATRSNDVNLMKCGGSCPTGTLTHHYLGGLSVTITFDGSATADWTAGTKSGTVALLCTPAS